MAANDLPIKRIFWILLSISFSFPWLIPLHPEPWSTFYNEIAAGGSIAALAVLVAYSGEKFQLDHFAIGSIGIAAIPLIQAATGMFKIPSEAGIIAIYLFTLGITIALGRTADRIPGSPFRSAFFFGLGIAAIISSILAFAQILKLNWSILLAPIVSGLRPVANVGQPNELATLLVWGIIAILWGRARGALSNWVAGAGIGLLLFGIVTTQSRTGWVELALLFIWGFANPSHLGLQRHGGRRILLGWLALTLAMIGAWEVILRLGVLPGNPIDAARFNREGRFKIWKLALDGIAARPWFGYGWDQGRVLQVQMLPAHWDLSVGFQHAHNILLDLLIWNGIPIGLLIFFGLCYWLFRQLRTPLNSERSLMILIIGTFMIHASLELPHTKAFFLLPVCLLIGALNGDIDLKPRIIIAPCTTLIFAVVGVLLLGLMIQDFSRIREDLRAYRMRSAWAGIAPAPENPKIYLLDGLQTAFLTFRIKPTPNMSEQQVEQIKRVATRYPIPSALTLYAKAAALNHQSAEAKSSLIRLCLLYKIEICNQANEVWNNFRQDHKEIDIMNFSEIEEYTNKIKASKEE